MRDEELVGIISELVSLKYEGSYWDFKQEHHSKEKKHELLHDIICLANNLENKESYLIIGVSDTGDIKGFSKSSFRRNQQQLNNLVRNQYWEGHGAPDIKLKTITINQKEIDVVVIASSAHVPFTFSKDIKIKGKNITYLSKHTVYTRIQDSNTPHDSAATINEVETLMKYRLGILPTPIDSIRRHMGDIENWSLIDSNLEGMSWYYMLHPEYTIDLINEKEDEDAIAPSFTFVHMNERSSLQKIKVKYHNTIIYWTYARYIDETRALVVYPDYGVINIFDTHESYSNLYPYYYKDSIKVQLSLFIMKLLNLDEYNGAWERHLTLIPIYEDTNEKEIIERIVNNQSQISRNKVFEIRESVFVSGHNLTDKNKKFVEEDIAVSSMIVRTLNEIRKLGDGYK